MIDLQAIADHVEIEALRGEFKDYGDQLRPSRRPEHPDLEAALCPATWTCGHPERRRRRA